MQATQTQYVSTATLIIIPPSTSVGPSQAAYVNGMDITNMTILTELLTSQQFLDRVIRKFNMNESWLALRTSMKVTKQEESPGGGGGGGAILVNLSVKASDSSVAAQRCEAIANEGTHYLPEVSAREYRNNRLFLERLVEEAREKLAQGEASVLRWQEKHQALDVAAHASELLSAQLRLQQKMAETTQKVTTIRMEINDLKRYLTSPDEVPWDILKQDSGSIPQLQETLATEKVKLATLEGIYAPRTSQVTQQRILIQRIQASLTEETRKAVKSLIAKRESDLHEAQGTLAATRTSIRSMGKTWSLAKNNLDYSRLQRQIGIWNNNYQQLLGQLYSARIAEQNARREGSVAVIESPQPGAPVGSGGLKAFRRMLMIAIPVCIGFGILVAFIVEYIGTSLKVRPRIEEAMQLPVLGIIPKFPSAMVDDWNELRGDSYRYKDKYRIKPTGPEPENKS